MDLSNLNENNAVVAEKDQIRSGGFTVESDVYDALIDLAYVYKADSGAIMVRVDLKVDGKTIRMSECVQSGDAKGNKTFYTKDGKDYNLPGFNTINTLCQLTVGKPLSGLATEKRQAKMYDPSVGADATQEVDAITALHGKKVKVGIIKETIFKQEKGADGKYHDTDQTREQNVVDKLFCAREGFEGRTITEIKAKAAAEFITKWIEEFKGKTIDRTGGAKPNSGAKSGAPTGGNAGTAAPADDEDLFG